ncbi:MAG: hypothetical protein SGI86_17750 [Deltaproteobacteria bacterium]|mgnify:CR=1 FL=1|nr:hypothetical protein [Deltaproteobacteria bacterium]
MRTTVDLDPKALERAKRLAQRENRTVGSVISEALAAYVTKESPAKMDPPFELIVRGRPGARFPSALDIAQAEEDEDLASLRLPRSRHADT